MNVVARVTNTRKQHEVELRTNERIHTIEIPEGRWERFRRKRRRTAFLGISDLLLQ